MWAAWRYRFDNAMSRGTPALIGLLGLASLVLIAAVSVLTVVLAPRDVNGARDAIWRSLLRTLDPGTMGDDQGRPIFLGLMLTVTVGGIFIVSALVGVLATGLDAKLVDLRKGRSRVVEKAHTVVLGWSEQLFTIVNELGMADERERVCVTILADRDKVAMEDELRARLGRVDGVRLVCRTGSPTVPSDLDLVCPERASAIIVPTPLAQDADIRVIKTLLALQHRSWPDGRPPVVASIADSSNVAAARLAGGPDVTLVDAEDVTARLIVQSRRHPGLSAVCTDLLGFDREEIHTCAPGDLVGRPYGDALLAYATATVFGLRHADGTVQVNPAADTIIAPGDELIVLAPNKRAIRRHKQRPLVADAAINTAPVGGDPIERTLVLGWNQHGPTIVSLLDRYLPRGSALTVAAPVLPAGRDERFGHLANLQVQVITADPTSRRDLQNLQPEQYEHVVVLGGSAGAVADEADSRTLVTLLHLRDIKERQNGQFAIVAEISDDANRSLAAVTRADDFVVSTKMISLLITQLSRNSHLTAVFADLFDPGGSDIFLKPSADYVVPDATVSFATVIEAARRRGQTAIGYRKAGQTTQPPGYGVVLNPDKSKPLVLSAEDRVVVLSQT